MKSFLGTIRPTAIIQYSILLFAALATPFQGAAEEIFHDYPDHLEREIQYRFPTERFIDAYGWESISSGLKSLGVSMVHRNLFDRVWHREEVGFLGYHGSTQEYRLYQDIIRMVLEEHLEIPIREDFHFFRIPGDPQFHNRTLSEYGDYQWNYSPTHFLCMNYALYGNFQAPGSCSYYYFAHNSSANHINYEPKLVWLFDKLGINRDQIHEAFTVGHEHLSAEKGILMQVFDMSHYNPWEDFYQLADEQCGGFEKALISEIVAGTHPKVFPWQIRMLMSNRHTLNPFSSLVVKRYDALAPEEVTLYQKELRAFIRTLVVDQAKAEQYKTELFQEWEVDGE